MPPAIIDQIKTANNLPSLPAVAMQVLKLTDDNSVSVADIALVVQQDPALTAKILKRVNSALYGIPREIASLRQAMMVLGLRTVKVLALSFSVVDALHGIKHGDFDYQGYWRRSITTSVTARALAKITMPRLCEEAFIAGLLADAGMIAAWQCAPDLYKPVITAWAPKDRLLTDIETELLGTTHAQITRELLFNWLLPQNLCDAIGAHHDQAPDDNLPEETLSLAKVLQSAAQITALFCEDIPNNQLQRIKDQCIQHTGITDQDFEQLMLDVDDHVKEAAALLSLDIGKTINYMQLQTDAAIRLAQLSMEAEVERTQISRKEVHARMEVSRLQEEKQTILEAASTDGLTKIANRAAFDKRLAEELQQAKTDGHYLSLIMMDVDHFKRFNDTHGHQAGDEVLRNVAACLKEVAQKSGFVARYGGEEFAVIVARETAQHLKELANQIRSAIQDQTVQYNGQDLHVTASLGAACIQPQSRSITSEQIIDIADKLLYLAKQNGRNRVELAA